MKPKPLEIYAAFVITATLIMLAFAVVTYPIIQIVRALT